MAIERLHKILAAAGVDSRRNCEQLILQGLVKVNGRVVNTLPAFADIDEDTITVEGRRVHTAKKVYYLFNKPKGVICTNYDPSGRRKAIDFINSDQRIFCVGRLDTETTGAIILTNDSALVNHLTHPRYCLERTYVVGIKGRITPDVIERLKRVIGLSGNKNSPAKMKILNASEKESLFEIKVRQGLNREIREIMAKFGCKVTSIKRTQIGRISLFHLGIGNYRPLTTAEVNYLKKEDRQDFGLKHH